MTNFQKYTSLITKLFDHQPYFNHISTIFQPYFNYISTIFQPYYDYISTIFQLYFNCILTMISTRISVIISAIFDSEFEVTIRRETFLNI